MLKSLVAVSALALLAVTSFGGTANANGWNCATSIMRGGCPLLVRVPDQKPPTP